jgi:hypothetical protein
METPRVGSINVHLSKHGRSTLASRNAARPRSLLAGVLRSARLFKERRRLRWDRRGGNACDVRTRLEPGFLGPRPCAAHQANP